MKTSVKAAPFFGWRVVWAAFVLAIFGWGVGFYGPPIFLHAVIERTGWPLALVSSAVTFHFLAGAAVVANLARLYARFGVPRITTAGALSLGLGVLGWALAAAPWQLFAAAFLSGVGWVAMGAAALNAIISPWFVRRRPAALSTAYNGASIGGVLLSPLWVVLIAQVGFPVAAALIGTVMLGLVWVLSNTVFAKTPDALGQFADGDGTGSEPAISNSSPSSAAALPTAALWRDVRFLTLAAGMALGLFAQIGLIAHLVAILAPIFGTQGAGFAMGLATACAILGRSLVGWLMPARADRRLIACASYAVQLVGSLTLIAAAGESLALLLLGVVLFGSGIGNATSLPPLIAQAEHPKEQVQRVVSLIVATGQTAFAFAPAAFGLILAVAPEMIGLVAGDPAVLFAGAAVVQALAIACFLAGRRRPSLSVPAASA